MRRQMNKGWLYVNRIEHLLRTEVARVIKRFHHNGSIFIAFERALRHPEDNEKHLQAKCLGLYALRHIDDHADKIPKSWLDTDAVMLPMLQSEALRIYFHGSYPFAIKIGQGNINAITGKSWKKRLNHDTQVYLRTPKNKWINLHRTESGVLKQFVAPRLDGKVAKKPITHNAIHDNSIQIQVYPLKAEVFFRRKIEPLSPTHIARGICKIQPSMAGRIPSGVGRDECCQYSQQTRIINRRKMISSGYYSNFFLLHCVCSS